MAKAKTAFYIVTYENPNSEIDDFNVLSRTELISFLRKGYKFISIGPLERPDFSGFDFSGTFEPSEKENDNG